MKNTIKVLFQSRSEIFDTRGGDTLQMEHTKKTIEDLDTRFKVTIDNDLKAVDKDSYDIVNLFNLDWICETYLQAKNAQKKGIPLVLSAIHHPMGRIKEYEKYYKFGLRRVVNSLVKNQEVVDIAKNLYRSAIFPKKLYPTLIQAKMGIKSQQKQILEMSDVILVQTDQEREEIIKDFNVQNKRYEKVVIGADASVFLSSTKTAFIEYFLKTYNIDLNNRKIILSVGRIEPRKNQLTLIDAFERFHETNKDYILIFIGAKNSYHIEYAQRFQNTVSSNVNIFYTGALPQQIVASAMACDGICVQPSWFETIGLTNVEAFMAGMKVVTSTDRLKEFFGEDIFYCVPDDTSSITQAMIKAHDAQPPTMDKRQRIANVMNWNETAKQTIAVYESLLR